MPSSAHVSYADRLVAAAVPLVPKPLVERLATPYLGGSTLEQALVVVEGLRRDGLSSTVDIVGEGVTRPAVAASNAGQYLTTLDEIAARTLPAHVSVKPSGVGSRLSNLLAQEQLERIVERAEATGSFVRIDMEDSTAADPTLHMYERLVEAGHDRVGIVLQARLWRTASDVARLAHLRPNVRLCKGIYLETPAVAMQDAEAIRSSFIALLEQLLLGGSYVGIATHDEDLIVRALRLVRSLGVPPDGYEFQMLLGVRPDLARLLAREHLVRVYVPYGSDSLAYAQRRFRENPQIAGYVARDIARALTKAIRLMPAPAD